MIERKAINGQEQSKATISKPVNGHKSLESASSTTEEEPKAPVSDSRWLALRRCLPVLAPLPPTAVLVTLHLKQLFSLSAADRYINEVQKALVLANVGYGALIVGSVSAIALHRIRY